MASGSKDNTIKIWHTDRTSSLLFVLKQTLYGHTNLITCLVRLFEDEYEREEMASSSRVGEIRIWSPLNQNNDVFELKQTLVGHKHYVLFLASKGFYLANGSLKEIRIWHLMMMIMTTNENGRQVRVDTNNFSLKIKFT